MSSLWRLIPWPYRVLAIAALAAALVGVGWATGAGRVRSEWVAANAAAEIQRLEQQNSAVAEALQIERRAAALGQGLAKVEQGRATMREAHAKTVTKEVIRYVERERQDASAGRAVVWLDADWVRGHDLAAAPPESAGTEPVPAGEAGSATAGDALAVVSGNYEQCYRWRDQVIGWQEWYQAGE